MRQNFKSLEYTSAKGLFSRLKGLIGKKKFSPFFIPHCQAVHTFGMKVSLDLLWLDKAYQVIQIDKNIKPGKIRFCRKAEHILECPENFSHQENIKIGNFLKLKEKNYQKKFLQDESGQALVEAAFILPLLMMLIFGTVQLGIAIHELQKLTYVTNFAAQSGSLTNDNLKITGAVEEYYAPSEVTVQIESFDTQTENIKNNADRRYKDILTVKLEKPFNLKIPFITISVIPLKAESSARILCSNNDSPYTCL